MEDRVYSRSVAQRSIRMVAAVVQTTETAAEVFAQRTNIRTYQEQEVQWEHQPRKGGNSKFLKGSATAYGLSSDMGAVAYKTKDEEFSSKTVLQRILILEGLWRAQESFEGG